MIPASEKALLISTTGNNWFRANLTIVWLGQCTLGDFTPIAVP